MEDNASITPRTRHIPIKTIIQNPIAIHSGEITHHQDQEITLHSFKTMNTTVRMVGRPAPLYTTFSLIII